MDSLRSWAGHTLDDLLYAHLVPGTRLEDERRVRRIAEEARDAFRALAEVRKAVAVFGSARTVPTAPWADLARRTASALSAAGFAVITGGGPGLMAAANEAARSAGGGSIGLTIDLPTQEEPNPHLGLRVPFHYFFLRKLAFVKYSCAFVCLPGGFGTLDELFEALNLKVTHKMDPFPVILVGRAYWEGLVRWLEGVCMEAGALSPSDLQKLEIIDDPATVVARVEACHEGLCRRLGIHHD